MKLVRSDDTVTLLKNASQNKGGTKITTSMMVPESYKKLVEHMANELGMSQGLIWRMIVDEWIEDKLQSETVVE